MDTRWIRIILSGLLAALMLALPAGTAVSGAVCLTEGGSEYTLEPRLSDGVSIVSEPDSLTVMGHESGEALEFDETKQLSFTVELGEGWSYSGTYSVFFPGDGRASVTENEDGTVTFTFDAVEGEYVSLSDFGSVAVNASVESLPKLYIDAAIPFEDIDRDEWVDATYTLTLGTKQFESGDYSGTGKVKGRGNSSWQYPKKPYSIKLDKKASLLDIPKTKKYAVIPSYYDASLMRNYITYKAYQDLIGIDYVTKCEFVDVYLNGEYNGIYILVERIDVESTKVDIEEASADNLTGGYLIEKDVYGRVDFNDDLWFNCPYWANQTRDYFVCKAPEPDDPELWSQMRSYLENYMQLVHDSIMNGEGEDYTHYVDTSSWVDFIIVQEVAKNIDGPMKTSCWLYKQADDDHIYMTAPWDFDFAYGRVKWTNASTQYNDYYDCPTADTYEDFMIVNSSNPWMDKLYDTQPEFNLALRERYTQYRHTIIDELFDLINEQGAYLSSVQQANYDLWHMNFANGVRSLRTWLTGRVEWLDSQWLLEDEPEPVIDLDEALNIEGGELHFDVADEALPFEGVELDGVKLARAIGEGEHGFSLTYEFSEGDFIAFDHNIAGEGARLTITIDGEEALVIESDSGAPDRGAIELHRAILRIPIDGVHTLRWAFTCGIDGEAYVDNVSVDMGCMLGDVDMNGVIDSTDALLVLRYALGIIDDPMVVLLGDVSGNGVVDTEDALIILRKALGII